MLSKTTRLSKVQVGTLKDTAALCLTGQAIGAVVGAQFTVQDLKKADSPICQRARQAKTVSLARKDDSQTKLCVFPNCLNRMPCADVMGRLLAAFASVLAAYPCL